MIEEGEEPLLELGSDTNGEDDDHNKGGFKTLPFIIGAEGLEKMATYGLTPNMTVYLMGQYHMGITTASNVFYFWSSATNFMQIFWAIISDSFLGQFYTIGFGTIICFLGSILMWSTTIIPNARPPPCNSIHGCSTTFSQFVFLCGSLGLISIGAGGIRSSCLAFGANQLRKDGKFNKTSRVKESYFSWYYVFYTFSVLVALTCVVYIQDNLGWRVGFAVPAMLLLLDVFLFFSASLWYIKLERKTSLVTDLVMVVVASCRNWHLKLSDGTDVVYHHKKGSSNIRPSQKLRFLNKACMVKDPQPNTRDNGLATNSWNLCTVEQVEELKSLLRVIPIWCSGMIMNVNVSQVSFQVLQAASMNRKISSSFEFPAASFSTLSVLSVIIWVIVYDRVFLPLASKVTGRRIRISAKTRMGVGIFLSFTSMLVTAAVESFRRRVVAANMSALWLLPQYCLTGFAEGSNVVAQNEFYFSELPRSMWSIAATLNGIGMASANLVASVILNCVDVMSKEVGHESWISDDIDKGRYDYYYLVLAGLSMANLLYFLVCRSAYGPSKWETNLAHEENES